MESGKDRQSGKHGHPCRHPNGTKLGCKEENVAKTLEMIREAAQKGANLITLPELCNTGYMFNSRQEVYDCAELVPGGPTCTAWEEIAKELNVYLVAGITEVDADGVRCFNTAVLIGPNGYIGKHRKLHLWYDDKIFFEPGDLGYQVFQTPIGRIGMLICFDMWYFEDFRLLALKGADIVCCPTNWVDIRRKNCTPWGPTSAWSTPAATTSLWWRQTASHRARLHLPGHERHHRAGRMVPRRQGKLRQGRDPHRNGQSHGGAQAQLEPHERRVPRPPHRSVRRPRWAAEKNHLPALKSKQHTGKLAAEICRRLFAHFAKPANAP